MAADPFNSRGGYSVGIPPIPIIDANGNLTVNNALIGNVTIIGDQVVGGNIIANIFVGTFEGNISGNLVVPGQNTWVLFNNQGQAGSSQYFKFDQAAQALQVEGDVASNSLSLGIGNIAFSVQTTISATTASMAPDQVLHRMLANTVCSVDYTVIATDAVGNNRQTSKLITGVLGTEVEYYEYGTIRLPIIGSGVGDFGVRYSTGNVELTVSPYTAELVQYKIMVTSYKE
jgi:hypothetical protein